jgi:hypothetical protein
MPNFVLVQFIGDLERYGAGLAEWPPSKAAAARRLLAGSEDARAAHGRAARLAGMLAPNDAMTASDALRQRLLDAAPAVNAGGGAGWRELLHSLWPFGPLWRPAAGLGLAAIIGVAFGLGGLPGQAVVDPAQALAEEVLVLASAAEDAGENDE